VAQECIETKDGLHVWEDHFYPEIIETGSGRSLPDGERGELVFTTLTKEGLPLIRYRTRDLTVLRPGTARSMRRIERITGRSDDMLIIRGVNVFPSQIEELILQEPLLAPHYQLVVSRDGHLDSLEILVEPRVSGEGAAGAAALQERIRSFIGLNTTVTLAAPEAIARSQGKAQRVVDRRPRG
jgi:phenylacetate-CoA ligase